VTDSSSTNHGKLFVIGRRCGRLANRMVLFANFIAFAKEQGHRVANVTFHSYADLFQTTSRDIYCRYPVPSRRSWIDVIPGASPALRRSRLLVHAVRGASVVNEKIPLLGSRAMTLREDRTRQCTILESPEVLARVQNARVVFAYGWNFRAPASVRRHADEIRNYFRPVPAHEQASRDAVERLRRDAEVVVGIHVRRTDYRGWKQGKYFYEVSQYLAAMRQLAEQFSGRRVSFLVCGDEPRRLEEFPGLKIGPGTGSPVGDLFALARCDYLLGPPSTFSQWASFYGNTPLFHLYDPAEKIELGKFQVSFLDNIPGSTLPL
jgi:hypothetical protein